MAGFFSSIFASKPSIPKLPKLDLTDEQTKAIAANQASLPGAEKLATSVNTFNYDQLQKMLGDSIPGLAGIQGQVSSNILSQLKGEIPQDVQDSIMRTGAWKQMQGGSNSIVPRDLALTSLDISNKAMDSATKWITLARTTMTPGQFDVSSMFITPLQKYQTDNEQNIQQFQRKYASNVNNANFSLGTRAGVGGDSLLAAGTAAASEGGSSETTWGGSGGTGLQTAPGAGSAQAASQVNAAYNAQNASVGEADWWM